MSNAAITWALAQPGLKASHKWLLAVLANAARDVPHVSKATRTTWPALHAYLSVASLCEVTELDRKTVLQALHELQEVGLIVRAGFDGQTRQVPVYRLVTSAKNGTGRKTTTSPKNGTSTGPKSGTSPKTEPVPNFPPTSPVFSGDQSLFSPPPVPKTGHETIGTLLKPKGTTKRESARKAPASKTCPEEFAVTEAMLQWAREKVPGVDLDLETEKFRNHEFKDAKSAWPAAWRNWMLRAQQYGTAPGSGTVTAYRVGRMQEASLTPAQQRREHNHAVTAALSGRNRNDNAARTRGDLNVDAQLVEERPWRDLDFSSRGGEDLPALIGTVRLKDR